MALLRGSVGSRIGEVRRGDCTASLLALAGLCRLGLEAESAVVLDPDSMVPAAGQGVVGITAREDDLVLRELIAAIEDPVARTVSTAERAMLAELDGPCRSRSAAMPATCRTDACTSRALSPEPMTASC